jgi:hypothetical protein
LLGSQVVQVPPLRPQALSVGGAMQRLFEQHPPGHDVESQTQTLPRQRCPPPQGAFAPHLHWPPVQVSALLASQATQLAPLVPQLLVPDVLHRCDASQQPVAQEVPSQTHWLPRQRWPLAQAAPAPQPQTPFAAQRSARWASQATQVPPSLPHAPEVGLGLQVVPWQQPAQDAESQTQAPPEHRCPATHGAPAPHAHWPVAVQLSVSV